MEKLEDVDFRDTFLKLVQAISNPVSYRSIWGALEQHDHFYLVSIDKGEFGRLLLNSSTKRRELALSEYPTIDEVADQIEISPEFLAMTEYAQGGLSGIKVSEYLTQFNRGADITDGFILIMDVSDGMRTTGSYYIRDGMHRLVAFRLSDQLRDMVFPIPVFYCTNQVL